MDIANERNYDTSQVSKRAGGLVKFITWPMGNLADLRHNVMDIANEGNYDTNQVSVDTLRNVITEGMHFRALIVTFTNVSKNDLVCQYR